MKRDESANYENKPKKDLLWFLYNTILGRMILKPLVNPKVSRLCGKFLDTNLSTVFIPKFVEKNNINMDEYEDEWYYSFNEFFTRRIKPELRPIDPSPSVLIAPSDGELSIYRIRKNTVFPIKQTRYTLRSLLKDRKLAKKYENGWCMVYRLGVDNYHRYIYPDNGRVYMRRRIRGVLHTVRPVALEKMPVFSENTREYMILNTENFGHIIQMEVGAMLVGKIDNSGFKYKFKRGKEKGKFLYGGSTIVVLLRNGPYRPVDKFIPATNTGMEVSVKMGEAVMKKTK